MKKPKGNKNKDRIINIIVIVFLLSFITAASVYFYNDSLKLKRHMAECVEICKPDRALEIFSKKGCFCQEVKKQQNIQPKNSI